jgi:hypothetical protein
MLSMLDDVRRVGGDVDDETRILFNGRRSNDDQGRLVLIPERTREACFRRGLLAAYCREGVWRFALTVAGAEALRIHRRRRRAVGAQIQRELVAALEEL